MSYQYWPVRHHCRMSAMLFILVSNSGKAIVETQTRLGAKVIVEAFNNIVYSSHYKN